MDKMLPVIMNDQFVRLDVIDDYSSFIWSTRYYTSGDFQLIVDVNSKNKSLFQKDYYVVRDDDENVGIIEDIQLQRTEDGKDQFVITGRFLDAIIARRIIAVQTTVSGKVSACIEQLLDENIINPSIAARQIDNFVIQSYEISTTMEAQYTGKNLLETISKICQTYGCGYKVTLNDDHEYVFQLYEGENRTYDQSVIKTAGQFRDHNGYHHFIAYYKRAPGAVVSSHISGLLYRIFNAFHQLRPNITSFVHNMRYCRN